MSTQKPIKSNPKTFLLLYAKAGGGHESAAKSIGQELEVLGHLVVYKDILENTKVGRDLEKNYVLLTMKFVWLWNLFTILWKFKFVQYFSYWVLRKQTKINIENSISEAKPDIIISTYFFANQIAKTISQANTTTSYYTLVSEVFMAPPIWFTFCDNYLVFSSLAYKQATQYAPINSNIQKFGYFYNKSFDKLSNITPLNTQKVFNIVITGGGSTLPRGLELVRLFANSNLEATYTVICGRDEKLKQNIEVFINNHPRKKQFEIIGFTSEMKRYLTNSDLVVTKAGPALIFECLSLKKPIYLYHYIWEQEKGNMEFVVNSNFGIYQSNLVKLLEEVKLLQNNPNKIQNYQKHIEAANIKSDIDSVVSYLTK